MDPTTAVGARLAHLALHQPYTYRVVPDRGPRRPTHTGTALARAGCATTINLCREMPDGDVDLLEQTGLTADQLSTVHIPVTDCTPPGRVTSHVSSMRWPEQAPRLGLRALRGRYRTHRRHDR